MDAVVENQGAVGKLVSQLDADGYFVEAVMADPSPLEEGVFLIPRGCIEQDPPTEILAGKRYRPEAGGWVEEDVPQPEAPEIPDSGEATAAIIQARLAEIDRESTALMRQALLVLASGTSLSGTTQANALASLQVEADQKLQELAGLQ